MCEAALTEEEESDQREEETRTLPGWVGSIAVIALAALILGAGGFGLYSMLAVEPEPRPAVTTASPSPTPTPVASPTPTDSPTPTSAPTPLPPRAHDVQEGETLSDIAALYEVPVDEILSINPEVDAELIRPGQILLVPVSTQAAASGGSGETNDVESGSGGFAIHVVSSGETLSSIAEDYNVPVSVLQDANDLSPDDETIRAGQSLVIPLNTPTPTPTATSDPDSTPSPVPPYASPPLLYPPDGAFFDDEGPVLLQWASVDVLEPTEWYELRLWQPAGGVVSSTIRTRATAWRVPLAFLQGAAGDAPTFRWRVQVVREAGEQVAERAGAPSEAYSFTWLRSTPTRQSLATPTP